ncbi:hypothetical protein V6N13_043455 [Hibiscus sabdariffa]
MPTPPASHQSLAEAPSSSPADAQNDTPAANPMDSPTHTPEAPSSFASTPVTPPSPPAAQPPSPAPTTNTPPLHILQLRNQIQRIEARKLTLLEEKKVFQNTLINFLCFQFPHAANFFPTQPTTAPLPAVASAADPSVEDGQTEPINLSKEDIFDWKTPIITPATITSPIEQMTLSTPQSPAKRQRRYHVVSGDSDDDGSADPPSSKSLAF